jgi:hypothetical protein
MTSAAASVTSTRRNGLKNILGSVAAALLLTVPAAAQPPANTLAVSQPPRPGMGDFGTLPVPFVAVILDHRRELGLSTSQDETLERLGLDVTREAIRRQADLMIAQVDLLALLDPDPAKVIDIAKVEAKLREVERIRTDVQLALIRAVETLKAALTTDQRAKLATLITGNAAAQDDPPGETDAVTGARGAGHPPSGGAVARPHGPAPHLPTPHLPTPHLPTPHPPTPHVPIRPRFEPPRHVDRGLHARVFVGPPLWWDPYWAYPLPPAIVQPPIYEEPPIYMEQPPAQTYWYYCPSLRAYYPYVSSCPEPWVSVPSGGQ